MRPTCSAPSSTPFAGSPASEYGLERRWGDTDYAIRVVAEHARAASVLISDGVVPSNSERGYVLRRIIRRAIRYGRQLGLDRAFMTEVAGAVIDRFAGAYPALSENRDFIQRVVGLEEIQFLDNIRLYQRYAPARGHPSLPQIPRRQSAGAAGNRRRR